MANDQNGTVNGEVKPQRSWAENVRHRGVGILMRMVMPILYDKGDESGRATKAHVREIIQYEGSFIFVLEIANDMERGRLIGQRCLNLSALSLLFRTALRATFRREEGPDVVAGIWDPFRQRTLMPQRLFVESDLEPEEPVPAPAEEATGGPESGTAT